MVRKRTAILSIILVILMMSSTYCFAHSGRTDSSGGHRDNKNKSGLGYYHYHHGYGPHLHSNGICPYSKASATKSDETSSNTSSRPMAKSNTNNKVDVANINSDIITVKIPSFSIKINNHLLNNKKATYPIFVYRDITYLPLTWDLCDHLGYQINSDGKNGLKISSKNIRGKLVEEKDSVDNASELHASISKLSVEIDGYSVEDSIGKYPVLQFRDITYIPLTSGSNLDALKLSLFFDQENGLVLTSN